jgi:MFS family permease
LSSPKNNQASVGLLLACLLAGAASIDYVHRQVMAVVLQGAGASLAIGDAEMSWLLAIYALTFVAGSVGLTFTIERYGRRRMLCLALLGLGLFSLLGGLTNSYWPLLLCRALMGLFAALLAPAAQAIIGHYFQNELKIRAIGLLTAAAPFGLILGFGLWGWIVSQFGWQWALACAGFLSLFFCLLLAKVPADVPVAHSAGRSTSMYKSLLTIFEVKSFRYLSFGFAAASVGLTDSVQWGPTILVRNHGLPLELVGIYLAIIFGVVGTASALLSGQLASRLVQRLPRIPFWLCVAATLVSAPLYGLAYLSDGTMQMLVLLTLATLFGFLSGPQLLVVIQTVIPNHLSAQALGLTSACFTGFSMGITLPLLGYVSDLLAVPYGEDALRYAMVVVPSFFYVVALLFYGLGARHFQGDSFRKAAV